MKTKNNIKNQTTYIVKYIRKMYKKDKVAFLGLVVALWGGWFALGANKKADESNTISRNAHSFEKEKFTLLLESEKKKDIINNRRILTSTYLGKPKEPIWTRQIALEELIKDSVFKESVFTGLRFDGLNLAVLGEIEGKIFESCFFDSAKTENVSFRDCDFNLCSFKDIQCYGGTPYKTYTTFERSNFNLCQMPILGGFDGATFKKCMFYGKKELPVIPNNTPRETVYDSCLFISKRYKWKGEIPQTHVYRNIRNSFYVSQFYDSTNHRLLVGLFDYGKSFLEDGQKPKPIIFPDPKVHTVVKIFKLHPLKSYRFDKKTSLAELHMDNDTIRYLNPNGWGKDPIK